MEIHTENEIVDKGDKKDKREREQNWLKKGQLHELSLSCKDPILYVHM